MDKEQKNAGTKKSDNARITSYNVCYTKLLRDNSGAREILVIRVLQKGNARWGSIGDTFVGAVKEASSTGQVRDGEVVKAVVVRTKDRIRRPDSYNFV